MNRLHPYPVGPVSLEDFHFLADPRKWVSKYPQYSGDICQVNDIKINAADPIAYDELLKFADRSSVGKGTKTVRDESVRASNEIKADMIELNDTFLSMLKDKANEMARDLSHPGGVKIHLHKLIIYRKDDFFSTHIDSNHRKGMIMTLTVNLYSEGLKGGSLVINNRRVKLPERDEIGLVLFYNDTKHRVTRVRDGYKLSLVFDVVSANEPDDLVDVYWNRVINHEKDKLYPRDVTTLGLAIQYLINHARDKGFKRLGFAANYAYISEKFPTVDQLKGVDKLGVELFKKAGLTPGLIELYNESGDFFHPKLLPIIKLSESFSSLYHSTYYSEEESEEEEDEEDDEDKPVNDELEAVNDEDDEDEEDEEDDEDDNPKEDKPMNDEVEAVDDKDDEDEDDPKEDKPIDDEDDDEPRTNSRLRIPEENVYDNFDDSDNEGRYRYYEKKYYTEDYRQVYQSYHETRTISPNSDTKGDYVAIDRQYLLGDLLLLNSCHKGAILYEGDEEVHLGNEGFSGRIYQNLVIVFNLD